MSSSSILPSLVIFIIVVIGVIALIAIGYGVSQNRRKAWADLAERIGAQYEPGNFWIGRPTVSGIYQQHRFKLDSFTRSTGKSSTTYTRLEVYLISPDPLNLTIYQEGFFSKIGKKMGMQDIQIGDEEIDQRYVIQGQPEEEVRRIITALGMRQRLIEAPELHIEIKDSVIRHEKRGFEADPNTLIALLDILCAFGRAIDRPEY